MFLGDILSTLPILATSPALIQSPSTNACAARMCAGQILLVRLHAGVRVRMCVWSGAYLVHEHGEGCNEVPRELLRHPLPALSTPSNLECEWVLE